MIFENICWLGLVSKIGFFVASLLCFAIDFDVICLDSFVCVFKRCEKRFVFEK